MKVLLRVRQPPPPPPPSSLSQNSVTASPSASPSPTTVPSPRSSSNSGLRSTTTTTTTIVAATASTEAASTAATTTTSITAEPSNSCNPTSDSKSNLSIPRTSTPTATSLTSPFDCPTTNSPSDTPWCTSSTGITRTTLEPPTSITAVPSIPPLVPRAAVLPSPSTASVPNELSSAVGGEASIVHHGNQHINGSIGGSVSTHTKSISSIAATCNASSNHSSAGHTPTIPVCHSGATPLNSCSELNHNSTTTATSDNNSSTNTYRDTARSESTVPIERNESIRILLEQTLEPVPLHDCTSNSTTSRSSPTTTATNRRKHQTLGIERKRKASRIHTLEIESKPPSAIRCSDSATTRSSTAVSSTSRQHGGDHKYESPSFVERSRGEMGQFYRSDGGGREGEDPVGENNITTTKSSSPSSSSSSSTRHRMLVHTNEGEESNTITTDINPATPTLPLGAATTTRTTIRIQQNEHPALGTTPYNTELVVGRNSNDHQLGTTSSFRPDPTRGYLDNHKFSASTAAVTDGVVEEEELEEGGVEEEEGAFQAALKKRGLEMVEQEGDGNCLFRAVSLQVYGDAEVHMDVRKRCLDFMSKDEAHFSEFVVDEPFMQYILRKRQNGVHGNNPEIQAISELYNRPVEVFVPSNGAIPINIFQAAYKTCDAPLRLSYHDGNHYNAVTDPLCPTAGLGLGLPGLEPGLADRMQMKKAVDESEDLHADKVARESHEMEVQKAILESKRDSGSKGYEMYYKQKAALMVSDMEATDFELEQAALVDSLKSHYSNDAGQKQPWNHNRQHKQQHHSRDRRRYQSGQSSSASSTRFPEIPSSSSEMRPWTHSSASSPLVASLPSAASAAVSNEENADIPAHLLNSSNIEDDEYPQTVQELVMNGFPLERVVKAYNLIGDNFDDLLSYLMSSGNGP